MRVLHGRLGADFDRPTALTLGNFDGVHRGHQALIARTLELAQTHQAEAGVVLFEPQPREFFGGAAAPPRLYSLAQKLEALRALGLPLVRVLHFDAALAALSAEKFVRDVLLAELKAKALLVGDDWRFGCDRQGDFSLLQALQADGAYVLERSETVLAAGERISSTRVRAVLAEGDIGLANDLLGRAYAVRGPVIYGRQLGRQIGAPTANVRLRRIPPLRHGVYVCWLDGLPAVANFGTKPTLEGEPPSLEVHVLDRQLELYNRRVEIRFAAWLRAEQRFPGVAALAEQIQRDVAAARDWHAAHPQKQSRA